VVEHVRLFCTIVDALEEESSTGKVEGRQTPKRTIEKPEFFALTDLSWLYKREKRVYVDLPRAPFKQFKKPHSPP